MSTMRAKLWGKAISIILLGQHFIHAFSWTAGGGMIDLGTVPGFDRVSAHRVSARGQVVGNTHSRAAR